MSSNHATATAEARTSCHRCHKRKKRCDRALPSCRNCRAAHVRCSFLDDDSQTASYSVAYVRNLERKLHDLEQRTAEVAASEPHFTTDPVQGGEGQEGHEGHQRSLSFNDVDQHRHMDISMGSGVVTMDRSSHSSTPRESGPVAHMAGNSAEFQQNQGQQQQQHQQEQDLQQLHPLFQDPPPPPAAARPCFVDELKTLSFEATAERHLGSPSGISFARLTQFVLRRLTPDKADFVFVRDHYGENYNGAKLFEDFNSPSDLLDPSLFERLNDSVSIEPLLFGDVVLADIADPNDAVAGLELPGDQAHIARLVEFYFAHSHTLYPILHKGELLQSLQRLRGDPHDPAANSPSTLFRIWMVLAIGSTAYSSVSLSEESESRVYYNKALQYLEQAVASGDMVRCTRSYHAPGFVLVLQPTRSKYMVSGRYGCQTCSRYRPAHFVNIRRHARRHGAETQTHLFLHLHDGPPFAAVDDEYITPHGIRPPSSLQPCLMAVPLHILRLRRIAGKITRQVYSLSLATSHLSTPEREAILHSLHQDLLTWRREMPFPLPDVNDQVPHLSTAWFDFNYYTHVALLYRPSPLLPTMDLDRVKTLEEASSMSIRQAFSMHRQRRLAYNWLNLLALFTSTLSRIYATTVRPESLVATLKETRAIEDLDLAIALFDTLGVKFPAANKIRGMVAEIVGRYKDLRASG